MNSMSKYAALAATLGSLAFGSNAGAQEMTQDLMSQDTRSLRSAIEERYNAALAMTLDPSVINANDTRYIWASEAKVQCGIALGFLKSSTRDETSIAKCAMASDLMTRQPAVAAVPVPVPVPVATVPQEVCSQRTPGLVFFEFDSADPPAEAEQTIQYVAQNAGPCGWTNFEIVGHTDRAGSNAYNQALSARRAMAVADLMASMGIPRAALSTAARGEEEPRVPTEDEVRNPQNRRVEISVK